MIFMNKLIINFGKFAFNLFNDFHDRNCDGVSDCDK